MTTIYIVDHYSFTGEILKRDGILSDDESHPMYKGRYSYLLHPHIPHSIRYAFTEFTFLNEKDAIEAAEQQRIKKIEDLQRQIDKVKKLKIKVTDK